MIPRLWLLFAALVLLAYSGSTTSRAAPADSCFPNVGCLDSVYARLADLQALDCERLAAMRAALTTPRSGKSRTLKERGNLRLINRVERQKNCTKAALAKKAKPPAAIAQKGEDNAAAAAGADPASPSPEPTESTSAPTPENEIAASSAPEPAPLEQPSNSSAGAGSGSVGGQTASEPESSVAPTTADRGLETATPGTATAVKPAKPEAKPSTKAQPGFVTKTVFYATDRKPSGQVEPNVKYGAGRGTMVYGIAEVSIPNDHRIGELEAPSLLRLEFSEDPKNHVVLLKAEEASVDKFYQSMAARLAQSPGKNAFIFVHGYNVSFKDAARRTAQIAYDLKFDGIPTFFSWPSQGTTLGYTYDEDNVEWAAPDLKQFIADFASRSGADNIYLVAHSMGTRALVVAIKELFQERPELKTRFREIILAAPDIDAGVFRRSIAPAFKDTNVVTLYASSKDLALSLSKQFNGNTRAGDSGSGLLVLPGIDTIDASDVDTDFVGHAYFGASTSIITDIYEIFRGNTLPAKRPHLQAITDALGAYWKFRRGAAP